MVVLYVVFCLVFIVNWGEIVLCIMCMVCCFGMCIVVVYFDVDCDVLYCCVVDLVLLIGVL